MMYVWAVTANGRVVDDITTTGVLPTGCTAYDTDVEMRRHESGESLYIIDGQGGHRLCTQGEIEAGAKYKKWWNEKIEKQLEKLDIKRIRSVAEISDDNTRSQDKQTAKATIKILNEQAAALRAQIIK